MNVIDEAPALEPETERLLQEAAAVDARLGTGLAALLRAYEVPPDLEISRRHLDAMLGAARPISETPRSAWFRRKAVLAILVPAAVLAVVLLPAGLSFARVVTLPKPIRNAYSTIGIHLPEPRPATRTPSSGTSGVGPQNGSVMPESTISPSAATPTSSPGSVVQPPSGRGDSVGRVGGDNARGDHGDSKNHSGSQCDLPALLCGI